MGKKLKNRQQLAGSGYEVVRGHQDAQVLETGEGGSSMGQKSAKSSLHTAQREGQPPHSSEGSTIYAHRQPPHPASNRNHKAKGRAWKTQETSAASGQPL